MTSLPTEAAASPRDRDHGHAAELAGSARPAIELVPETGTERQLVDPRTGIVTRLVRHPPEPRFPLAWIGVTAHVADTTGWAGLPSDRHGFGAALGDEAHARAAAVGEAIERYCGNLPASPSTVASYEQLTATGRRAVDPEQLALFSPRQHGQAGFPFQPFTRHLPVAWAEGTDLMDGAPVWAPASLVHLSHRPPPESPPTNPIGYSGIATGRTLRAAQTAALEEVFERDATTIWWASGAAAIRITGAEDVMGRLDDPCSSEERNITLLAIPSELPVAVVAAFIEDHPGGFVAFGSSCRAQPRLAAEKALVEAFGLLSITRQLADPDSDLWRAVAVGAIPAHTYKPYRADRAYRHAFHPAWHDLVDLPAIAQLYLDPIMSGPPLDRLRHPADRIDVDALPSIDGDPHATYLDLLKKHEMTAVGVDLTTSDVRSTGLAVARVIVPGLCGNAPPAYPYRGGRRLYQVPVQHGWVPGPLDEDALTSHPLPLA